MFRQSGAVDAFDFGKGEARSVVDMDALAAIAGPDEIWKYFTLELNKKEQLQQWMETAMQERAEGKRMPFVIINKDDNKICGCTSFGNIYFYDKRI